MSGVSVSGKIVRRWGVLLGLALSPALAAAQEPVDWNAPRALEFVTRARERRAQPVVDSLLRNYHAKAAGMVYFYLDRRESEERTPVKSDQIALEVYWGAPNRTKQRIVGMRGENALPNRMYYHLDHLTVVQNEFGDVIRLGDGDEVRDVPHPAAPGSDSIYDFRIADSLTIRLPGAPEPVRTYQVDVRPKRTDRSAFVGSLFLDRATADIVRMTFTFTPAAYVDRRLDYINISLDNSLWDGRYWLPYEQAVEIRRQLPELDFIAGAVILGRFRISDYEFNLDLPPNFFAGNSVTAAPRTEREAFEFESTLYQDLIETGLAPPAHMRELRAQAAALLRKRALSGLPRLRPSLPNASSAFRYNRAEGTFLGAGASYVPGETFRAELTGGYAFGANHGAASVGLRFDPSEALRIRSDLYYNALRDLGVRPGAPGALNTISALSFGEDFLDPFYARGARLSVEYSLNSLWDLAFALTGERHDSATLAAGTVLFGDASSFRPVRPVDEGRLFAGRASIARVEPETAIRDWGGKLTVEAGSFDGHFFARPTAELTLLRQSSDLRLAARLRAATGFTFGSPASQQLFLLGGRETLPGYAYRSFLGEAFGTAQLELSRQIASPWLGVRLLGATGLAGWLGGPPDSAASPAASAAWTTWNARPTAGLRTSIGAGASFFYDILRLDLVRGLNDGGEWQLLFSVTPRVWGFL
jgi:hypothetical protein